MSNIFNKYNSKECLHTEFKINKYIAGEEHTSSLPRGSFVTF